MGGVLLLRSVALTSAPLLLGRVADYAPFDFVRDPSVMGLAVYRRETVGGVLEVLRVPERRSSQVYLFIHGLNGSWMSWTPLLRALDEMCTLDCADVVVLDMRQMAIPTSVLGLEQFTQFLVNDVCAGWDRVHVVGHSVGGGIALAAASWFPSRVASVHLVAASFMRLYREARARFPLPLSRDGVRRAAGVFRVSSRAGTLGRLALWVGWKTRTLRRFVRDVYFDPDHLADGVIATIPENFSPKNTRTTIQLVRSIDQVEMYGRVHVPVYAVVGEADRMADADDLVEFRKALSHTEVHLSEVRGTGHCPHIERPYATVHALFPSPSTLRA